jgi:hypothetical protein
VLALLPGPADAGFSVRLAPDVTTIDSATGGTITLQVLLHGDSSASATVAGYDIYLDLTDSASNVLGSGSPIGFSTITQATSGYVFDGVSAGFTPAFLNGGAPVSPPSPSVYLSDLATTPVSLGPGDFAIGTVQVSVAAGATPGSYGIAVNPLTDLLDPLADSLPIDSPVNVSITISPSGPVESTPVPASAVLFGVGSVFLGAVGALRNRFRSRVTVEGPVDA